MKEIENKELSATFEGRKLFLSSKKADYRHTFDGLTKLVREQMGYAPKPEEVYVFLVEGNDQVKILMQEANEPLMCELTGEQARRMTRICMDITN